MQETAGHKAGGQRQHEDAEQRGYACYHAAQVGKWVDVAEADGGQRDGAPVQRVHEVGEGVGFQREHDQRRYEDV